MGDLIAGVNLVCYVGSLEDGEKAVAPLRAFARPAVDLIGPVPYTAVQRMLDGSAPWGMHVYLKSAHLTGLSDAAIDTIVQHAGAVTSPFL